MIWVNIGDKSYQATGINVSIDGEKSALWIEKATGKTMKVLEGTAEQVREHKEAIDFAIKQGHKTYEVA